MTGVLLAADAVTLYRPGDRDGHGWREPGSAVGWSGTGNLQLAPGPSDPGAGAGGGHGPSEPAAALAGQLYLPADAEPAEGMTAEVRGQRYTLSQVRFVTDPAGGGLGCWAAAVTARPAQEGEAGG